MLHVVQLAAPPRNGRFPAGPPRRSTDHRRDHAVRERRRGVSRVLGLSLHPYACRITATNQCQARSQHQAMAPGICVRSRQRRAALVIRVRVWPRCRGVHAGEHATTPPTGSKWPPGRRACPRCLRVLRRETAPMPDRVPHPHHPLPSRAVVPGSAVPPRSQRSRSSRRNTSARPRRPATGSSPRATARYSVHRDRDTYALAVAIGCSGGHP